MMPADGVTKPSAGASTTPQNRRRGGEALSSATCRRPAASSVCCARASRGRHLPRSAPLAAQPLMYRSSRRPGNNPDEAAGGCSAPARAPVAAGGTAALAEAIIIATSAMDRLAGDDWQKALCGSPGEAQGTPPSVDAAAVVVPSRRRASPCRRPPPGAAVDPAGAAAAAPTSCAASQERIYVLRLIACRHWLTDFAERSRCRRPVSRSRAAAPMGKGGLLSAARRWFVAGSLHFSAITARPRMMTIAARRAADAVSHFAARRRARRPATASGRVLAAIRRALTRRGGTADSASRKIVAPRPSPHAVDGAGRRRSGSVRSRSRDILTGRFSHRYKVTARRRLETGGRGDVSASPPRRRPARRERLVHALSAASTHAVDASWQQSQNYCWPDGHISRRLATWRRPSAGACRSASNRRKTTN